MTAYRILYYREATQDQRHALTIHAPSGSDAIAQLKSAVPDCDIELIFDILPEE